MADLPERLNQRGAVTTLTGTVHRPLPDVDPDGRAPKPPLGALLLEDEYAAIHTSSRPLARLKARAEELQAELHDNIADRAKLARLQDEREQLEADRQGAARGSARVACLQAVEAAATRAAVDYVNAASIVAEHAARYEAACQLHDRLLGLSRFDGLGVWRRDGKLLAPEQRHRPRDLRVMSTSWGIDSLWSADSQQHQQAVEAGVVKLRSELQHGLNGSGWPF